MSLHDDLRTYGRQAREERDSLVPPDPAFGTGSLRLPSPSGTRGPAWWQYAAAAIVAIAAFFGGRLSTDPISVPPTIVTRIDTVILDSPPGGTADIMDTTIDRTSPENRPAAGTRRLHRTTTTIRRPAADHLPNRFVGTANIAVMTRTGTGSGSSTGSGLRRFTTSLP